MSHRFILMRHVSARTDWEPQFALTVVVSFVDGIEQRMPVSTGKATSASEPPTRMVFKSIQDAVIWVAQNHSTSSLEWEGTHF